MKRLIALFRGIGERVKKEIEEFNRFADEAVATEMYLLERKASRLRCALRYMRCNWFWDLHDYPDDLEHGAPCHFTEFACSYCGKKFTI